MAAKGEPEWRISLEQVASTTLAARGLWPEQLQQLPGSELSRRFMAAVIDEQGREVPITDAMIEAALAACDGCLGPARRVTPPRASTLPLQ